MERMFIFCYSFMLESIYSFGPSTPFLKRLSASAQLITFQMPDTYEALLFSYCKSQYRYIFKQKIL